jgi:hypothetical protein
MISKKYQKILESGFTRRRKKNICRKRSREIKKSHVCMRQRGKREGRGFLPKYGWYPGVNL